MSKSLENRQLSRSKIDLFIDCPRCFHAEVVLDFPRIGSCSASIRVTTRDNQGDKFLMG